MGNHGGVWMYHIVTGVTSDVGVPSTYLVNAVIFNVSEVIISITGLYPALAVAIGPHVRAQASSEITTLTPLNVFVLAAANPATGKSSAFRAAVEKPMRMIEESLQCPFLYSVSHINSSTKTLKNGSRTTLGVWRWLAIQFLLGFYSTLSRKYALIAKKKHPLSNHKTRSVN